MRATTYDLSNPGWDCVRREYSSTLYSTTPPVTHGHLHGKYLQLDEALRPWVALAIFLVFGVMLPGMFPSSLRVPLGNTGGTEDRGEESQGPAPLRVVLWTVFPENSYVDAVTSRVVVFGDGACKKVKGGALIP